ncbi:MAG: hypothetical protein U9Q92_00185 [archaeon]|nr:hypothetical protein [archaeon]
MTFNEMKLQCLAWVERNATKCEEIRQLSPKDGEFCYMTLAIETKNESLCEGVHDESICRAVASRDVERCDLIEESDANQCYRFLAFELEDAKLCKKFSRSSFSSRSDTILSCEAFITRDPKKCGMIESDRDKDECYLRIAAMKGDASICDKVENSHDKNICVPIAKRNVNHPIFKEREDKYKIIAILTEDASYCDGMADDGSRDQCYGYVVLIKTGVFSKRLLTFAYVF